MTMLYDISLEEDEQMRIKQRLRDYAGDGLPACEAEGCLDPAVIRHAGYLQTQFCTAHNMQFEEKAKDVWEKYATTICEP